MSLLLRTASSTIGFETDIQPFVQLIAQNALTILINLSQDEEVLGNLAEDDAFLEAILKKITVCRILPPILNHVPPLMLVWSVQDESALLVQTQVVLSRYIVAM